MSNINYDEIREITVHNQKELDDIPLGFKGGIYVNCTATVKITNRYYWSVVAWGNSSVVARGNSSVVAWENSSVVAWENSSVAAWGNSSVAAWGNSSVVAWENSSVEARENSSVVAWENSSVVANANVQVVNRLIQGKIKLSGNAREVFMPKTIFEFMDFYGIKHTNAKAIFYKAVRKRNSEFYANYDNDFKYVIGEYKSEPNIDKDVTNDCGSGIHISTLSLALDFGAAWDDLAIIKVETKIDNIVLPQNTNGQVRTSEVKVIEELPLNECGAYGEMLAKKHRNTEELK